MTKRAQGILFVVAALALLIPATAFSQTVTLQINNPPSNNVIDGIYVGSYSANNLTSGGTTQVTCDDFKDDSDYNVASYTTNSFSNLGSTIWGSTLLKAGSNLAQVTNLYDEAAWLTLGMLKLTGTQQAYYSFAIWATFDPGDVASWLTSYGDSGSCNAVFGAGSWAGGKCNVGKGGLLGLAASQTFTAGEFSNVQILTPVGCSVPGTCKEQEFFQVVPEGGTALLYLLLAGVTCFGAILLRSRQRTADHVAA